MLMRKWKLIALVGAAVLVVAVAVVVGRMVFGNQRRSSQL